MDRNTLIGLLIILVVGSLIVKPLSDQKRDVDPITALTRAFGNYLSHAMMASEKHPERLFSAAEDYAQNPQNVSQVLYRHDLEGVEILLRRESVPVHVRAEETPVALCAEKFEPKFQTTVDVERFRFAAAMANGKIRMLTQEQFDQLDREDYISHEILGVR